MSDWPEQDRRQALRNRLESAMHGRSRVTLAELLAAEAQYDEASREAERAYVPIPLACARERGEPSVAPTEAMWETFDRASHASADARIAYEVLKAHYRPAFNAQGHQI